MTSGLASVARYQRDRLLTVRGQIQDALRTDGLKHDPFTTKLSLAAEHVAKAIEILKESKVTLPKFDTEAVIERRKSIAVEADVWSPVRTIWVAMQDGEDGPVTCLVKGGTPVITGDRLRIGTDLYPIASVRHDDPLASLITFSQPGDSPKQTGASAPAGDSNG